MFSLFNNPSSTADRVLTAAVSTSLKAFDSLIIDVLVRNSKLVLLERLNKITTPTMLMAVRPRMKKIAR